MRITHVVPMRPNSRQRYAFHAVFDLLGPSSGRHNVTRYQAHPRISYGSWVLATQFKPNIIIQHDKTRCRVF